MQPSLGGICLSFFLSAGELQAPCPKKNEFPESVRRRNADGSAVGPALALALWRRLLFREDGRNADGFSRHRINNAGRFTALP